MPSKRSLRRGDVAVARVYEGGAFKVRPVLVVQSDHNNARLTSVIVAMVTSNTKLAGVETTVTLVDPFEPAGASSGLLHRSAVKCENLYTLQRQNLRKIGRLSDVLMDSVDAGLRASLSLD